MFGGTQKYDQGNGSIVVAKNVRCKEGASLSLFVAIEILCAQVPTPRPLKKTFTSFKKRFKVSLTINKIK